MPTSLRSNRKRFLHAHATHAGGAADPRYGLLYPPNHLRLVDFSGDPEDITRGLLTFDRDLGPLPGDVNLWCGDKKAFSPTLANPRVVRVSFNCPIYTSSAWSWDTAGGDFTGADGCAYALPASGTLQYASGPHPAGKIWITAITRYDATTLDYQFSTAVNTSGDASGFWCIDDSGNTQSGNSVNTPAADTLRIGFPANIGATPAQAGIVAGFSGIAESADLLSPITWRV